MNDVFKPRAALAGWLSCYALTLVLMAVFLVPVGSTQAAFFRPMVPLILVYVLTIDHQIDIPLPAIAALGLIQDALTGGILGLNVIVLMTARLILSGQQLHFAGQPFLVNWLGFVPVTITAAGVSWAIGGFYADAVQPVGPVMGQTLFTVAAYPFFALVFGRMVKQR